MDEEVRHSLVLVLSQGLSGRAGPRAADCMVLYLGLCASLPHILDQSYPCFRPLSLDWSNSGQMGEYSSDVRLAPEKLHDLGQVTLLVKGNDISFQNCED